MEQTIPYKIYLEEQEMPRQWYNVRADMKKKPAPILNPGTLKPITLEELSALTLIYPKKYWIFTGCTARRRW